MRMPHEHEETLKLKKEAVRRRDKSFPWVQNNNQRDFILVLSGGSMRAGRKAGNKYWGTTQLKWLWTAGQRLKVRDKRENNTEYWAHEENLKKWVKQKGATKRVETER